MADLELAFIGSGNAFAPGGLCWNGFVANGRVLFEAPPSALMALNRLEVDPNALETVVISHHHGDHFLGLPFLLLHWKYRNRSRPVTIVGPKKTRETALEIANLVYPGVFDVDYQVNWVEAEPGRAIVAPCVDLEPVEVCHDERLSACLGFLAKIDGATMGYTGDSAMCDGVMDLARKSRVLVSECASYDDPIPIHMNLVTDIPIVRGAMAENASLILTHLEPRVDGGGLPRTIVAEDFARYHFDA